MPLSTKIMLTSAIVFLVCSMLTESNKEKPFGLYDLTLAVVGLSAIAVCIASLLYTIWF